MSFGMILGISILHYYGNTDKRLLIVMKYTQKKISKLNRKTSI